jgi:hypothetical protein
MSPSLDHELELDSEDLQLERLGDAPSLQEGDAERDPGALESPSPAGWVRSLPEGIWRSTPR